MVAVKINRKLSPAEESMEILNEQANSAQVIAISRIAGSLTPEILRQSLDLVQQRHPRLNCRIVGSIENLYFETEGTEKIPLRVIKASTADQWQVVAIEELNQKINSQKCLARAALVSLPENPNLNYLITTINHAITDGISSIYLHQNILEYCQKIVARENVETVAVLPALPGSEDLLPSMRGLKDKINTLIFILRLQYFKIFRYPKTLKVEKFVPLAMRHCGLIHRQLNETLTEKVSAACAQKKVRVQGALSAAMLLAAFRRIKTSESKKIDLNCLSAVDLRRRLTPAISPEHISFMVSMIDSNHAIDDNTSFWELAQENKEQVNLYLERNYIFMIMKLLGKLLQSFLENINQPSMTVSVSNVGKVNLTSNYGAFQLEEISFAFGAIFATGTPTAAVTTFQGKMLINFMFSEPSISQEFMAGFVDDVLALITEACG